MVACPQHSQLLAQPWSLKHYLLSCTLWQHKATKHSQPARAILQVRLYSEKGVMPKGTSNTEAQASRQQNANLWGMAH